MAREYRPNAREFAVVSKLDHDRENKRQRGIQILRDRLEEMSNRIAIQLLEDRLIETTGKDAMRLKFISASAGAAAHSASAEVRQRHLTVMGAILPFANGPAIAQSHDRQAKGV